MMSPRVFPNLRRMNEFWNLLPLHKNKLSFYFFTSFPFHNKEIFPLEHGNIIKLGELPRHNALGFFWWGGGGT
jgi:hypothetical protein